VPVEPLKIGCGLSVCDFCRVGPCDDVHKSCGVTRREIFRLDLISARMFRSTDN
jgi:hypothetical protein